MRIGMLWFDANRGVGLGERIARAAGYYRDKYGCSPNICVAHPSTLHVDAVGRMPGLKVRPSSRVLPDHFWLGVEEETQVGGHPGANGGKVKVRRRKA